MPCNRLPAAVVVVVECDCREATLRDEATAAFEDFVRGRSTQLFHAALLLAGGDRLEAEDLVQIALERMYRHRRVIFGGGAPDAYARRVLVNAAIDWRRRLRRRPESALQADTAPPLSDRAAATVDDRDLVVRALRSLPARQRAVLVLRYLLDLPDPDVAAALDCSIGTVRSQASRGLDKMRRLLDVQVEAATAEGLGGSDD